MLLIAAIVYMGIDLDKKELDEFVNKDKYDCSLKQHADSWWCDALQYLQHSEFSMKCPHKA